MMRIALISATFLLSASSYAAPVHVDLEGAHLIVVRPVDRWNPVAQMAERGITSIKKKMFGFQYVDANGATIIPNEGGLLSRKVSTPMSEELFAMMAEKGWKPYVAISYFISAPKTIDPGQMPDVTAAQNKLFEYAVLQQGNPAELESRYARRGNIALLATIATAGFGISKLGNAVDVTNSSSMYNDIAKIAGASGKPLLPLPLPEFDYSSYAQVDLRRVTDNANNVGEIIIAYKAPKTEAVESAALARGIATMAGMDTTVEEVEAARKQDYEQRLAIWRQCQESSCMKH